MSITTENIRNIAVAGHGATGKTSMLEHLLFAGGAIQKAEAVESGKTVSDYTDEEISNKGSVHTALAHVEWKDTKINILDTPGTSDFIGEVVAAFRAAESTLLVVGAKAGVQIETIKLWRRLENRKMPRLVFINKMDEERASFESVMADLREKFDKTFVPVTIPIGEAGSFEGVVDLLEMVSYPAGKGSKEKPVEIPDSMKDAVEEARMALIEAAAEGEDSLLDKFLEEETLSPEEVRTGLAAGLRDNRIVPVLCGAALQDSGITALLDFIAGTAPSPAKTQETILENDTESTITISADESFSGINFKTSIDQFSGKLSYIKIVTGTLSNETEIVNPREQKKEKISKVYTAIGKKLSEASSFTAGDIAVLSKIASAQTNDSFIAPDKKFRFKPLQLPQPVHSVALWATNRKDEDKLSEALQKAAEQDLTFRVEYNVETKETIISGMGELHLNMILDKIREAQKIEIETKVPKVAYRETITKNADSEYTHKKQTGGHGQFGRVVIQIRPIERGKHYEFSNEIKGGAVSKGYVPGIEKGLHEAMEAGVLAGYPVVDVAISLVDGKEHPVDSSEMAFKLAARGALQDAMKKAGPALLEPVMNLTVFIEEQYLGDVLSDLSSRRGKVLGQKQLGGGIVEINAQVPQAELLRYSIDLRSITSGTGGFEMEFDHYNPIAGKIADDVIKAAAESAAAG
jgi:elongation factor G